MSWGVELCHTESLKASGRPWESARKTGQNMEDEENGREKIWVEKKNVKRKDKSKLAMWLVLPFPILVWI